MAHGTARTLRPVLFGPLRGALLSAHPAGPRGGVPMSRKRSAARHGRRPTSPTTAGGGARARPAGSYRCGSDGALRNRGGVGAGDCNRGRTQLIQRTGAIRGGRYFIYRPPRTVFDPPSSLIVATGKAPRFTPRLAGAPERRSTSTPSYWGALSACRRPPGVPVLSRSETVRLPPAVSVRSFGQARRARGSNAARGDGFGCHLA